MKKVNIGGVPEHFNMPWHYALAKGYFKDAGIDLVWNDYRSGSAPLAQDMHNGTLDLSVILTESIINSIMVGNNNSRIVSFYVDSPLVWGIHTAKNGPVKTIDYIGGKKYAISRFGSGSHLMALVYACSHGFRIKQDQFVVVNNLHGAVEALSKGEADIFFWEEFTTKPWVDNNTFRLIGECPTPWPCFTIAGNLDFLKENKQTVDTIIYIIQQSAEEFRNLPDAVEIIAERYHQRVADVYTWITGVSWSKSKEVLVKDIKNVIDCLSNTGEIDNPFLSIQMQDYIMQELVFKL